MYRNRWWAAAGSPVRVYWFHPRGGRVDWDWDLLLHLAKDKNKHTNKRTPTGPSDQSLCSLGSSTCSFMTLSVQDTPVSVSSPWQSGPWSQVTTVGHEEEVRLLLRLLVTRWGKRTVSTFCCPWGWQEALSLGSQNSKAYQHTHPFSMRVSAFLYQPCVAPSSCWVFRQSEGILANISQQVCCRSRSWCWYWRVWSIRQLCQELLFHPDYDKT